jgi:hypothetical protein
MARLVTPFFPPVPINCDNDGDLMMNDTFSAFEHLRRYP